MPELSSAYGWPLAAHRPLAARRMTDTTDRSAAEMEMSATRRILILISAMLSVALYFSSILVASTVLPQMQGVSQRRRTKSPGR